MAVDLPLCQALVQTNFPGREPVMTGLINLKRESKLTLEQKGNQGRVKILLWLQERKRGLKKKKEKRKEKKDNPVASGLQLLLLPPRSLLSLGPQGAAAGRRLHRDLGSTATLSEVLWDRGEQAPSQGTCRTQRCMT